MSDRMLTPGQIAHQRSASLGDPSAFLVPSEDDHFRTRLNSTCEEPRRSSALADCAISRSHNELKTESGKSYFNSFDDEIGKNLFRPPVPPSRRRRPSSDVSQDTKALFLASRLELSISRLNLKLASNNIYQKVKFEFYCNAWAKIFFKIVKGFQKYCTFYTITVFHIIMTSLEM